jgi:hypothetical protein
MWHATLHRTSGFLPPVKQNKTNKEKESGHSSVNYLLAIMRRALIMDIILRFGDKESRDQSRKLMLNEKMNQVTFRTRVVQILIKF